MTQNRQTPQRVQNALERERELDFELSCESGVGQLLAVLAAAVPSQGRVLELGTGAGVGLAWLVTGLDGRADVEVISVESAPEIHERVRSDVWPSFVRLELGDGADLVERLGQFDLIFADAPGGKLENLDGSITALRPGGILVLDDMHLIEHGDGPMREALIRVRQEVLSDGRLVVVELPASSGIILATRVRELAV